MIPRSRDIYGLQLAGTVVYSQDLESVDRDFSYLHLPPMPQFSAALVRSWLIIGLVSIPPLLWLVESLVLAVNKNRARDGMVWLMMNLYWHATY